MKMDCSPSLDTARIHELSAPDAHALVDELLGAPEEWPSPLLQFRLSHPSQHDWTEEVGHCLHTAAKHGYRTEVVELILKQAKRRSRSLEIDPNDKRHEKLMETIAAVMVDHYLCGSGWTFAAWEPGPKGGDVDVDLALRAPDGTAANLQVKAPERQGHVVNHREHDGENEAGLLKATQTAMRQLPRNSAAANFVVLCSKRAWPLAVDVQPLVSFLIGATVQLALPSAVTLPVANRGAFFTDEWRHVSAVIVLDYFRGADLDFDAESAASAVVRRLPEYVCTVLFNPKADVPSSADWFPHARVCRLDQSASFRWIRGEPGDAHTLPDGTAVTGG